MQVSISNAKINLTSAHRTDDAQEAIRRAVAKHYGAKAKFIENRGLSQNGQLYGQIGLPEGNGYNLVTGQVRVVVE